MARLAAVLMVFFSASMPVAAVADGVRIYKAAHKLQVLDGRRVLYEFPVSLGRNPQGHKLQEGDGRTPEGMYRLDYKNPASAFYKAIHISYPNSKDVAAAKQRGVDPGGQVMIHGQRNGLGWLWFISRFFDWTQGCVALSDDDMDLLWNAVDAGTTVEILP
ncbi:L,D-transpeptidase family protein [Methylomonas sp. LL1]|nr:L,D-transpeptidase family protein [Methylomonas sp. LL1]